MGEDGHLDADELDAPDVYPRTFYEKRGNPQVGGSDVGIIENRVFARVGEVANRRVGLAAFIEVGHIGPNAFVMAYLVN